VPSIVVYEACKRLKHLYGTEKHDLGLRYLKKRHLATMNWDIFMKTAAAFKHYQLHMADAVIWQTAQQYGATLYTQEVTFQSLSSVAY
jgi:predicted nucleic acid-binding protein